MALLYLFFPACTVKTNFLYNVFCHVLQYTTEICQPAQNRKMSQVVLKSLKQYKEHRSHNNQISKRKKNHSLFFLQDKEPNNR